MNKTEQKIFTAIEPILPAVQEFVDKNIVGTTTMTAIHICSALKAQGYEINADIFVKGFRLAIRERKITGIEGAQRLGYKRSGVIIPKSVTVSPEQWEKICSSLQISKYSNVDEVVQAIILLREYDDCPGVADDLVPDIGMGGTMHVGSDDHPFTVIEVVDKNTLRIQEDKSTRTDSNGMSECQTYTFEPNPEGEISTITFTDRWAVKGKRQIRCTLGERRKFFDYTV
jgi:hypothetical protein